MTAIAVCNFIIDTVFTLIYFRRQDNSQRPVYFSVIGAICLLLTFFLYPTGVFGFLSGSVQRYLIRAILLFLYVWLTIPIRVMTAVYAVGYWCTLHLLVQGLFFAPFTYPVFMGTAVFTGTPAWDMVLCILLTLLIKGICFLPFIFLTPLAGMSPIFGIDIVPEIMVAAVGLYARELAVPLTGTSMPDATELSSYYLMLQVVLIFLLGFLEFNRKSRAMRAQDQIKKQETEALLQNIKNNQENAQAISALRHDLKNHLISLKLLNQEGRKEELDRYIASLLEQGNAVKKQFRTGNDLADGLLSIKLDTQSTQDMDIRVTLDLSQGGFISNEDLCVLLGNGLDNALEACREMEPEQRKYISISGNVAANFLIIRIENSCRQMPTLITGLPMTSKADPQLHGFGLRNVRKVLDKYGGNLNISQGQGGQFVLSMMIPLPKEHS